MGFENLNLGDEIFVHGHRGKCAIPRGSLCTGPSVSLNAPQPQPAESPHSGGYQPPLSMTFSKAIARTMCKNHESNYEYNYEVIYELTKKITKSSLRMTRGIDSSGMINNVSLENLKKSLAP